MILTPDQFRPMPWANGKGMTLEMLRLDAPDGLLLRISRAAVVEEGEFSLFPGIDRNLTVLTGPGFDLVGEGIALEARPFAPVAFPGDVTVRAVNVAAPSDDFNVMTARSLPKPDVRPMQAGQVAWGDWIALYALTDLALPDGLVPKGGLAVMQDSARFSSGAALAVRLDGLTPDQMRKIG